MCSERAFITSSTLFPDIYIYVYIYIVNVILICISIVFSLITYTKDVRAFIVYHPVEVPPK